MRISAFHELDWTLLKINLYCSSQGVPEPLSSRLHDDLIPQLQRASVETGRNGDVEQLEHRRRQVEHVPSLDRPTSRDSRPMRPEAAVGRVVTRAPLRPGGRGNRADARGGHACDRPATAKSDDQVRGVRMQSLTEDDFRPPDGLPTR